WDDLLRTVPAPPAEPLAAAVPAEFWYLRASDVSRLLVWIEKLDAWGATVANVLDGRIDDRDLAARYGTQLGINRTTERYARFGPEIVESVALVGSDPYLREGSDLTAVFKVRKPKLFDAFLEEMRSTYAKAHGMPQALTVTHGNAQITVTASSDGTLR